MGTLPGFSSVRYDKRGCGLSDRNVTDFSPEARVRDVEAVVDALKLKKFYLFGVSEAGPIAMTYAAMHPRRVIKLALYGTMAYGGGGSRGVTGTGRNDTRGVGHGFRRDVGPPRPRRDRRRTQSRRGVPARVLQS